MSEQNTGKISAAVHKTGLLRHFIKILMFVDLPIRQKFLLFALSTFFWFCTISAVAIIFFSTIHYQYYQISEYISPYRQAIDSVIIKLETLNRNIPPKNESVNIGGSADFPVFRKQLDAIRLTLTELSLRQTKMQSDRTIVELILQNMAKPNPEWLVYMQGMSALIDQIEKSLGGGSHKLQKSEPSPKGSSEPQNAALSDVHTQIAGAIALSNRYLEQLSSGYTALNSQIYSNIKSPVHTIIGLLITATILLVLFTYWIIVAFYTPIKTIINQIESLSTGDFDIAKKVSIDSMDEIGELSHNFNSLTESLYSMTIFKKVIEEDTSLADVYRRLGRVFSDKFGIEQYMIYEVNTSLKAMSAAYPPLIGGMKLHCHDDILTDCTLCRAVKTGHNISSFRFESICRYFNSEDGVGHYCVPMMLGGHTGGVVQFRFAITRDDSSLSTEDASRLYKAETYIDQSLSVLEAKRLMKTLQDSALIDPMTGLYNRRFLQEHTQQIISAVLRRSKQVGLLVCDIDYFKQVNDTHGHDVGDQMLKETSTILKNAVRETDLVIRFGGEEFLVLLLDIEPGGAMEVAEKIRRKMESFKLRTGDTILQKTISIGISEFPADTDGFWQAIKYADVALYQAKETGRNRVVRFLPEMWKQDGF